MERLLSVNANMTIDIGGDCVSVHGDGSSLVVEVPSVSLAFQMMRDVGTIKPIRERAAEFFVLLSDVGLTVIVRTPSRKLITIGQDGSSWWLKLFGVTNARLHLS